MSNLWELFTDYQTQIISLFVTIIITCGATFLFHPAILVHYHEAIDHSIKLLPKDDPKDDPKDHPPVLLSLVIPAYNEEDRLTVMLDECYDYLSREENCPSLKTLQKAYQTTNPNQKQPQVLVEWIVISDGSSDQTCQVFENYVQQKSNNKSNHPFLWKLVSLPFNEGKGAAVQVGMTEATGYYRLMVDADGATTFDRGLEAVSLEMLDSPTNQPTIIFGSRSGDGAKRSALRQFLMHSFLRLRSLVVGTPVSLRDTQCGFKLFDQPCAMRLFSNLHLRRWAFDIELVYVALSMHMIIKEVTVPWHEVDGSKLNTGLFALIKVAIGMLRDMCCVRACYVLGIWKIQDRS